MPRAQHDRRRMHRFAHARHFAVARAGDENEAERLRALEIAEHDGLAVVAAEQSDVPPARDRGVSARDRRIHEPHAFDGRTQARGWIGRKGLDAAGVVEHLPVREVSRDARHAERTAFVRDDAERLQAHDDDVARGDVGAVRLERHHRPEVVHGGVHAQVEPLVRIATVHRHASPRAQSIAERRHDNGALAARRGRGLLAEVGVRARNSAAQKRRAVAMEDRERSGARVERNGEVATRDRRDSAGCVAA